MIATLTLNASLDLTVSLKKLDCKDINRIHEIQKDPGGKGINISRIIHRLKGKTVAFGFLGGYTGKKIKELLDEEGVPGNFVWISGENRSNITIDLPGKTGQVKINEAGPRINKVELEPLIKKIFSSLTCGDFLLISGSIPCGINDKIYSRIIRIAHRRGIKTVLDADGESLYLGVRAKPFLIKPNIYEAQRLLGRIRGRRVKISTEKDLLNAACDLSAAGPEIVIISWGPRGIIAASGGKFWRSYPPIKLKYGGVGAGDAVVAGFTHGFSRGGDIKNGIRWGIACGTAATLQDGTKLCKAGDVKRLLKKVKIV